MSTDAELHRKVKELEERVERLAAELETDRKKHAREMAQLLKRVSGLDARTLGSMLIG